MPDDAAARAATIRIRGARQNNLKNFDLDLPLGELIVVTGVSGSGKSSLVFDTLYAEGQRRYVETFSPYARQFLDRMDRPQVDRIDGVPPAIAIEQSNSVRTSRSTVGTMTEINDHLKLLYARAASLYCRNCAQPVRRDSAARIAETIIARARGIDDPPLLLTFPVPVPENFSEAEVRKLLAAQGYTRVDSESERKLRVTQDRLRAAKAGPSRLTESVEAALRVGQGRLDVLAGEPGPAGTVWRFSTDLHCADCDISYQDPSPAVFSFNSALGACDTCRGFGRSIGVDYGLVIPDESKSLRGGAIKPWQTKSFKECQEDLVKFARKRGIALDTPWHALTAAQRAWVIDGEGDWTKSVWYGVARFFAWLESKAYKMHIRVLLSRYRSYTECKACQGARLKPQALLWRLGDQAHGAAGPPGLNIHELMTLSIARCSEFIAQLRLPAGLDGAASLLLSEIGARLKYLREVGLGYLTLDRQSRTLSGGEVQRINLTTALGTSLVNTLFVLDEPSIGLHARDIDRIITVMQRLRDSGNTLVVVEHDAAVMRAADTLIDMGPGPGELGGEIVYCGAAARIVDEPASLTAQYLTGSRRVAAADRAAKGDSERALLLAGATENNLQAIDVRIPLNRLVCVTGVSGSGKSTLVRGVLYPALRRAHGKSADAPGAHRALEGTDLVGEVVLVDQTAIGKTTRSNPASYVGAFDAIRQLFAGLPEAKRRRYTAGTFSFNAGKGRCPTCAGNGFEHVEMQFLSDVYLRCPDCNGSRFRAAVLEVQIERDGESRSIAGVLELTVSEALRFFRGERRVVERLQPLQAVGLDYLRLGQAVPTLSGGEAQRLKLAGHLAETAARRAGARGVPAGRLYLFDEPTTGLHFDDIAKLIHAFDQLIVAGHSILVIEHNLDVIGAADWLIDLGPEGGEAGGRLVAQGTPAQLEAAANSHTGRALHEVRSGLRVADARPSRLPATLAEPSSVIEVHGAREHNLKNLSVNIDHGRFTVLTGVSGSGKSTLAFDIVFAEGQRRYLESLNAYARQFVEPAARADVDAVFGIPPTVAIEQRTSRGGRKSTVGTLTEIYHFLRLLFVKIGVQHCPDCRCPIEPQSPQAMVANLIESRRGPLQLAAPLVVARKGLYTALAKWARKKGYAQLRVDGKLLPTAKWPRLDRFLEHTIELPLPPVQVDAAGESELREVLATALELGDGVAHILPASNSDAVEVLSTKRSCPRCRKSFPELDPRLFSFNSKHGWCPSCFGTGLDLPEFSEQHSGEESHWNEPGTHAELCPDCGGARLNRRARHVLFRDRSIAELTDLPVSDFSTFVGNLKLNARERAIGRDVLAEIASKAKFLIEVGLGYLQLNRGAPTLSGGEAQRLRLAAQLGSNLRGVCYVLDEPTIGLHPRDNARLLAALDRIRSLGNTLLVVEHDEDTIRRADQVIDLGPGAGQHGGRVVAQGTAEQLMSSPTSITGKYLASPLRHPLQPRRSLDPDSAINIRGATAHNLHNADARIPLGSLTVITGVSGSGKSSLARDVLLANLHDLVASRRKSREHGLVGCRSITGWQTITRVLEVDQTPIGKTPRSCPATYVGFWDDIRGIFAAGTEARLRGYTASRFSFNSGDGRCAGCDGQGTRRIEMSFLPNVEVLCDQCGGRRFNPETLSILHRGKNIGEVLDMSVTEALDFFAAHRKLHRALALLDELGLGYLHLGQRSPTLSGGESQRLKLVTELAKVSDSTRPGLRGAAPAHTLYVLDEPTVGLHMADVEKLLHALHRLTDAHNTVVVIEHNLDLMAEADWIVDMGPEGGAAGGRVIAQGSPESLRKAQTTGHTSRILTQFLRQRRSEPQSA